MYVVLADFVGQVPSWKVNSLSPD